MRNLGAIDGANLTPYALNLLLDHGYIWSYLLDKVNKSVSFAFNTLTMIAMQERELETIPENEIDSVKLTIIFRCTHLDALDIAEFAIFG